MSASQEARYPSEKSQQIISSCIGQLHPDDGQLSHWHDKYVDKHRIRLAYDLDLAKALLPSGAKVLECGSAPFLLTTSLKKSGFDVTGCDLSPERYASTLRQLDLNVFRCDFEVEALPEKDNTFDAVIFNEVFEHLRINPIHALSEIHRVLKPMGILMLSSPNLKSLVGIIRYFFYGKAYSSAADLYTEYSKLAKLGHMGHVREYTTTEITEFLGHLGFHIDHLVYRGKYSNPAAQQLVSAIPKLRPFVSYIAKKRDA
ncbi:class I SAM-dependent methyltransferase [bacterium]|nr:class I SAM-dependent methyltransferase [bacterium]